MEIISEAHVFAEKTGPGSDAMETLIQENYGPLAYKMSRRLTTGAYTPARGELFIYMIIGCGLTNYKGRSHGRTSTLQSKILTMV
jgi:hypothetical protein